MVSGGHGEALAGILGGNEAWDLVAKAVCAGDDVDGPAHEVCYAKAEVLLSDLAEVLAAYVAEQQAQALRELASDIDDGNIDHEDLRRAGIDEISPRGWSEASVIAAYDSASVWSDLIRARADEIGGDRG